MSSKLTEKRLLRREPVSFSADGTTDGLITLSAACNFRVKQCITLESSTQPPLVVEVKRFINSNQFYVGEIKKPISHRLDVSAYTVADTATAYAIEQNRPSVPEQEIERITYEEEPVIARRVVMVDECGEIYNDANPFPVEATISTSSIGTPTIYNVIAVDPNTEYSQLLPNGTGRFWITPRNSGQSASKLQCSYIAGTTNTIYFTVNAGEKFLEEGVKLNNRTIYFRASKPNTVVEIISWN